jgi:hypothetical protein
LWEKLLRGDATMQARLNTGRESAKVRRFEVAVAILILISFAVLLVAQWPF